MQQKLSCYVRTFRNRWALTQPELGKLLGISPQQVSRIELGQRKPTGWIVLACQLIFDEEARNLFSELWEEVEDGVVRELALLQKKLETHASERAAHKRKFIEDTLERAITNADVVQEV